MRPRGVRAPDWLTPKRRRPPGILECGVMLRETGSSPQGGRWGGSSGEGQGVRTLANGPPCLTPQGALPPQG